MVPCRHSWQVWDTIHEFFHNQYRTPSHQLRSELRPITKGDPFISELLLAEAISDSIASVGDPIPQHGLFEILLEPLPAEFNPPIAAINCGPNLKSMSELEA